MTNVKVRTVGAVFNGQPIGSEIELTQAEAEHYAGIGYVVVIAEAKAKPATKSESAPTADKPVPKAKPKTKDTPKK